MMSQIHDKQNGALYWHTNWEMTIAKRKWVLFGINSKTLLKENLFEFDKLEYKLDNKAFTLLRFYIERENPPKKNHNVFSNVEIHCVCMNLLVLFSLNLPFNCSRFVDFNWHTQMLSCLISFQINYTQLHIS